MTPPARPGSRKPKAEPPGIPVGQAAEALGQMLNVLDETLARRMADEIEKEARKAGIPTTGAVADSLQAPQPESPPARPDPIAALNHALTEAGREALGYAPEGGLQGVAQKAMPYLAEQGYVLVNADMLAAALTLWEANEEDVGSYLGADVSVNGAHTVAAAILAALQKGQTDAD